MSDKTPKDELDGLNLNIDFPGTERENLTEEEQKFTFDEDYLDGDFGVTRISAKEAAVHDMAEEDEQEKENLLFSVFNKITRPAPEKSPPEGAEKPKSEIEPEIEPENEPGHESVPAPEHGKLIKAKAAGKLASRKAKPGRHGPLEKAPVTIGETLRSDEQLVYDSELDDVDYTDEEDIPEMRDYMPVRFRRHGRVGIGGGLLYGLFVISVSIVLACTAWMFASDVLALNKEPTEAVVVIDAYEPTGDMPVVNEDGNTIQVDIDQVATALKNAGVIEYKWLFKLYTDFSHAEVKIDPGTYDVSAELDYRALVTALQFGSGMQEITRITFPEGYNMEQIFTLLEENQICSKSDLYEAAANYDFDYSFLEDLPLGDATRLEGYLFPDTYDFYQGESATVAITRFLTNTNSKLTEDMKVQAQNCGVSLHEAIIIASLIEKEAGADEERTTIASVIYNRLRNGWKLQLDSTINYILNTSTFALSYADLETDSPYNTYMYEGLPAGPICNPGLSSIEAALNPESTDYWYWYAYEGETTFFTNSSDFDAYAQAHPYTE